ncbi:MAG: L,D-transpeptidase [candidate division Zixibacteria bacterium]|nr:L,D-transpeptidase [candidate division Zixibacteria bacterium]
MNRKQRIITSGVGILLCAFALAGCASAPLELSQQTWSYLKSSDERGGRGAPEAWNQAHAQYDSAWQIINTENTKWFFLRDYALAESLLIRASTSANRAIIVAKENRDRRREALAKQMTDLQDRLNVQREEADNHLARLQLRDDLTRAELKLSVAWTSQKMDSLELIEAAIEDARTAISSLEARLADDGVEDGRQPHLWKQWIQETVEWTKTGGNALVVLKAEHRAYLVKKGRILDMFPVELGYRSARGKLHSGDAATPEGQYRVTKKRETGSKYYKALMLDYPNAEDKVRYDKARRNGELPKWVRIGGDIEVHGEGGRGTDWTKGCVALANNDMDRVMSYMDVGDRVTIVRRAEGWPK